MLFWKKKEFVHGWKSFLVFQEPNYKKDASKANFQSQGNPCLTYSIVQSLEETFGFIF